ncbi:MAG: DUF47 family protein [Armatimonadota bacterium]
MKISFLPKEEKFFNLFIQQSDIIVRGAEILKDVADNLETINLTEKNQEISHLEHMGDDLVHEIAVVLNKTFVTPIDREDIHHLAMNLDDVMDYIQGAVNRLQLYQIDKSSQEFKQLSDALLRSCYLIKKGIELLPSFNQEITKLRKEMNALEREADTIHRTALARIFNGDSMPVLQVIKWKDIYGSVETATDKCEDVFDVLEAVVLKHA